MNDDWRLRVNLEEAGIAHELTSRLEAFDLAHDLRTSFGDRVIVSRDGPEVFCYAATQEQAQAAERAIRAVAEEHGWNLDARVERWHPVAEQWEDPNERLPDTVSDVAAERAELLAREQLESAEQGYPEYEVRVRCASQAAARDLAVRLGQEGIQTVQRREFLVVGAPDEDAAASLAERIRREAPADAGITTEASLPEVVAESPFATPFNPFAVFGGLAG
jgi:hypothetical protein